MTDRSNRRVLALMPHPDDMEILCAGTLIRLREAGFEVHVATMTPGDMGSPTLPQQEIAAIRRAEARRGAEAIGAASYTCLSFEDVEIVFERAARHRVCGMLRQVDPAVVFTTPPDDYMFDHIVTSQLVRDATFNAPMRNYFTPGGEKPCSGVPWLYYTDPVEGIDMDGARARATCIVDVTAVMERKAAALACHASQREWLRAHHGVDEYVEAMRRWSEARGAEAGFVCGEAFRQHRGHAYPREDLLATTLGARPVSPAPRKGE
ncbi:MAG TPA: PIG-L deacetylase family protein [Chthonomonadales bacterium]|nr:PIG-L deacetylase family protein [Chthonomonadales bacterium]